MPSTPLDPTLRQAVEDAVVRMFVATDEIDLVLVEASWRIGRLAFHLKFIDGNRDLEA